MSTLTVSLSNEALQKLLARLEDKAQDFQCRVNAFKGRNIYIAGKANRELQETEQLIILVKHQMHVNTQGE